eukprot:1589960-Rhodomonas_salina.1
MNNAVPLSLLYCCPPPPPPPLPPGSGTAYVSTGHHIAHPLYDSTPYVGTDHALEQYRTARSSIR